MLHKNKKHGFFFRTLLVLILVMNSISPTFAAISWPVLTPYGGASPDGILRDYLVPDVSNNRVGINTDTPSTRFDVFGTSGDADTQFVIDPFGNVGIGTASPQEKLHVEDGNARITPVNPRHVAAVFDNGSMHLVGASAITASGDYLYVTSITDDALLVFDISDPENPVFVGEKVDDAQISIGDPTSVDVAGSYAYVTSSDAPSGEIQILDISNLADINGTSDMLLGDKSAYALKTAMDVKLFGKYAIVAGYGDDGIQVVDISDIDNPIGVGSIFDDGDTEIIGPSAIDVSGDYVYVASTTDNGVEIIDISDPTDPTHMGAISDSAGTLLGGAKDILVSGRYAYVAASTEDGIEILDISDPTNPSHVASLGDTVDRVLNGASRLTLAGDYLYVVATDDNGIGVIDVSNPAAPHYVGGIIDNGDTALKKPTDIIIVGKYAYVTAGDPTESGLQVLDISGVDSSTATIGSVRTDTLFVNGNADASNHLNVHGALNVGPTGIQSDGPISVGPGNSYFGGNLLINTSDDSLLNVTVNINGDINTVSGEYRDDGTCIWAICISDIRLKTDIVSLSGSLQKILDLNPVTFRFLDEKYGKGLQTGLIAQEVEEVFPEWVIDRDDGYKAIRYGTHMQMHMIEALQELKTKTDADLQILRDEQGSLQSDILSLQGR